MRQIHAPITAQQDPLKLRPNDLKGSRHLQVKRALSVPLHKGLQYADAQSVEEGGGEDALPNKIADVWQDPAPTVGTADLGVYAQAGTATTTVVTDAGAGPALETATTGTATPGAAATSTSAATGTAAAATGSAGLAGLGLGALGLSGAVGLGVVALAAGSSKSAEPTTTSTSTEPTNAAPSALALTGALKGSGKNEIAENTPTTSRTKVADIAITDDGLGTNTLSLSGADKDRFEIVGNALYLKAGTALDFETKRSYAVTVQVQDSTIAGSPARSQSFELSVTDVDEVVPVLAAGVQQSTNVAENTPTDAVLYTAQASDNVAVAAYAFADGGADNDKFRLDATTGELRFKASPDFEAPASAAGTNTYTVKIKATDAAGNSATQTVTVQVSDVDEAAPGTPSLTLANDTNVAGDFLTRDGTLNISGLEIGATWQYSTDGGAHWQAGNGGAAATAATASIALPAGTYQNGSLLVRQTDAAGNISAQGTLTHPLFPAVQRLSNLAPTDAYTDPQICVLKDGSSVIAWQTSTADGQGEDLLVQRFNANGSTQGPAQRLQGMAGSLWDRSPQTTALSDGGYVVTWRGQTSDGQSSDVFVQRYNAANAAVGSVQRLHGMAGSLWDNSPQATALSDGGYVVTWVGSTSDGQGDDVFVQRYNAANAAVGSVQRLHGMAGDLWDSAPQTTALSDGGYVLTWWGDTSDGQRYDIFVQRYDVANAAVGGVQRLHGMAGSLYDVSPQTTALSDGGYVVTWQGETSDSQGYDVFVQRYNAANTAAGSVQRLHGMAGDLWDGSHELALLSNGGYVLVWQGSTSDGQSDDVFFQRFAADGSLQGGVQRLPGEQEGQRQDVYAHVKALPDGGFVIAWTNGDGWNGNDVPADAILVARYDAQGNAVQNPGAPLVVDPVSPAFANGSSQVLTRFATDPGNLYSVYDAQATANGGSGEAPDVGVLYRLGGADAALFTLDSKSGVLRFKAAPDTATPQDAGGDGIYNLTITAIDNADNTATQHLNLTILPVPQVPAIRLHGMAGNLWDGAPHTTALADGGYVLTWSGATSDGQDNDVFVQRYNAANQAIGSAQRFGGSSSVTDDAEPKTAVLSDGGYVMVWHDSWLSSDLYLQRFNAQGQATGGRQRVYSVGDYYNDGASNYDLTPLGDGGFVLAWTYSRNTYVQRYNAAGNAQGSREMLEGEAGKNDYSLSVTQLNDGGYLVTWSGDTSDGQGRDIFAKRYDAANNAVGSVQRLRGMTGNLDDAGPHVAALSDGGYVLTWHGSTSDGQGNDIFVQRYNTANTAVGSVLRLQGMAGDLSDGFLYSVGDTECVTALNDGGYVLAWAGDTSDGQGRDIFVKRYNAANVAVGSMHRLHGASTGAYDFYPKITALNDGGYVVVWQDFDICVQRFAADNTLVGEVYRMQGSSGIADDSTPQVTALADGGYLIAWTGTTSDSQGSDIFVQRFDVQGHPVAENGLAVSSSAQAFALWQEAETAWTELQATGSTTHDINALNARSMAIMQQHDATSRDGSANQADAAQRLTQWVDQVTGTDIVSQAEYQAGFTLTGHAAAGVQGSIKFYLDNDRTNGVNEVGTRLQDGVNGVHISYDNGTGEYSIRFDANSAALKPATHNTWGSGVHQLTVDTDGSGAKNGSEASRLFLLADGTAHSNDTGTVAQNYSVQDKITGDVFVYYYGDPDGSGVGMSTALDNGDTNANSGLAVIDKDGIGGTDYGDFDYYTSHVGNTVPAATAGNTALHLVTNVAAQVWEFHMGDQDGVQVSWNQANAAASNHAALGSNASRLASLSELVALYAANFGANDGGDNTEGSKTVGAVQPISNATWSFERTPTAADDNRPHGWDHDGWAAATVPGGNVVFDLYYANLAVFPVDMQQNGIVAIL